MIAVVLGTTGELIKLSPLLLRLRDRGQPALVLTTAQQAGQLPDFFADFGLAAPDVWLAHGHRGGDLQRVGHLPGWLAAVTTAVARRRGELRARLRADGRAPVVIVHGDTMTTVLGALIARALGAPAMHIEAGMRSHDWRDPFPEELNRRLAARLVAVHCAPGEGAVANLRREGVRGRIVDTGENTVLDAIDLAEHRPSPIELPEEPFGLVSLHRHELIERPERFGAILDVLREHAGRERLLFVDHAVTASAIARHGLGRFFDDRLRRVPRLRYFPFISLLRASRFLVTDSGGSQAECAFLGHPCLVHRAVTETSTGLDTCVVLSGLDLDAVRSFLADPNRLRAPAPRLAARPTDVVLAELERLGALSDA
jgi:UDP-N-acetylglucosamine 2-epimerase (non-hydrolysing)